jgi:hypothetical protein
VLRHLCSEDLAAMLYTKQIQHVVPHICTLTDWFPCRGITSLCPCLQKHERTLSGLLGKRPGVAGLTESAKEEHDQLGMVHGGDSLTRYFSSPQPNKDVSGGCLPAVLHSRAGALPLE